MPRVTGRLGDRTVRVAKRRAWESSSSEVGAHGCIGRCIDRGDADSCPERNRSIERGAEWQHRRRISAGDRIEAVSGLTHAERALLEFADLKNVGRGDYAVAGTAG